MRIKSQKSFSLIELIVVMAIIAILSTIAVPSFIKYRKNTVLRSAARAIAADFAYLKQRAVAEGVHYKIVLSAEYNHYKIIKGGYNGISSEYDEENAIIKSLSDFSSDIVISANPAPTYPHAQVIFQPRGTTSAGTIVLANDVGSIAKVVSNLMGRVRITFDIK
jgi:type II secretion system protein H